MLLPSRVACRTIGLRGPDLARGPEVAHSCSIRWSPIAVLTFCKTRGARASTGLCVDVDSGVMIKMKVIRIICSRSQ